MITLNTNQLLTVLLVLFVFIVAFGFMKPRLFSNRSFALIRVLFPSWRFFEDLGPVPRLFYRTRSPDSEFGPWILCLKPQKRKISQLLLNPSGNLQMACHSLVEQAFLDINERDPQDSTDFSESVSYQLIKNLVEFKIREQKNASGHFQFQIQVQLPHGESYQALLSNEHEVQCP